MSKNFDERPIVKLSRLPIEPTRETALTLERKAQVDMIRLFEEFCDLAETGRPLPLKKQNPERMSYGKGAELETLKEIPLDANAEEIDKRADDIAIITFAIFAPGYGPDNYTLFAKVFAG